MSDGEVPGYFAPVHRSLTEPMLVAGVPANIAIILATAIGILVLAWHFYALVPVIAVAYFAAVLVCRRDPHAFDIVIQTRGPRRYVP